MIAEVDNHRAEPVVIVSGHTGDIRKAGKGGCSILGGHVRGRAEHSHGFGEVEQRVLLNAELSSCFCDSGYFFG